jgi:hypothetical protein
VSTPNPTPHDLDLSHACWRKSSYSGGANDCVEVADLGPYVAVRDSKDPQQQPLVFERSAVHALVSAIKRQEFSSNP